MSEVSPATSRINLKALVAGAAVTAPLLAVLVLNLGRDPHALRSPLVGRPAPDFSLVPIAGSAPVTLKEFQGQPLVLNFWATWCAPCVEEQAALTAAAKEWPQARFVGVVYEDDETNAREFIAARAPGYPSMIDAGSKAAIAYGVAGVPETFFIDRAGRIVDKSVGPLSPGELAALLRRTAGGEP
jgi:cytochrome c biogenesis protein CcmG/thiol:disulfide interchange protein DsbE